MNTQNCFCFLKQKTVNSQACLSGRIYKDTVNIYVNVYFLIKKHKNLTKVHFYIQTVNQLANQLANLLSC